MSSALPFAMNSFPFCHLNIISYSAFMIFSLLFRFLLPFSFLSQIHLTVFMIAPRFSLFLYNRGGERWSWRAGVPAEFSSNHNQTHLNQLIKVFRMQLGFFFSLLELKDWRATVLQTLAASENLGSWLAASLSYEAMTLQAAFLHEGTSRNWFRTGFWGSVTV